MDKKNYALAAGVLLVIGAIIFWGVKQPQKANAPVVENNNQNQNTGPVNPTDEIIYFYGETCPHCIELNKFLEDNKIAEKVNFSKKEVWGNKANAAEMERKATECNIQKTGMGVPFVYARGKCYVGTPDAEAFFKQEAGIQ